MMKDLKEHGESHVSHSFGCILTCPMVLGMIHFIKEYVMIRSIPIPKLLYAFGVCLVSVPCSGLL